jgi:serine/threonine-protein kinase
LRALESSSASTEPKARRRLSDPVVVGLTVALLASLGALVMPWSRRPAELPNHPRARLTLVLPADAPLNPGTGFGNSMIFSPDGASLVYVGGSPQTRLYVRRLDELTARPIAGTEGALNPGFSPDGREIGFVADFMLKAVPATGGTPRVIAPAAGRFAWGPNNIIVFSRPRVVSPRGGLWKVSASGGTPTELTHSDSTLRSFHGSPAFLPDGRTILFSSRPGSGSPTLALARVDDGRITDLNVVGESPLYVRNHIVFARSDGTIAAVRFDAQRLAVIGAPVTLFGGVVLKAGGAAEIAVSSTGVLAYLTGTVGQQLVEVDRRGVAKGTLSDIASYRDLRVSPDGRRVAMTVGPPPYSSDIRVYDFVSGTLTPLTSGGTNTNAAWTPDGRRIAWTSIGQPNATAGNPSTGGVWWQAWDGGTPPELLVPGAEGARFTPSGDTVIASFDVGNATELRLVPLPFDPRRPATVILPARPEPRQPRLSPDGRWLAYTSTEAGARHVYIQPFPGPGGRFQISNRGGTEPVWGSRPTELFYRSGAAIMAATLTLSPSVTVVRRDTLFVTDAILSVVATTYDAMPNGHFVMVKGVMSTTPPVIVFGWVDEMKETVAAAEKEQ